MAIKLSQQPTEVLLLAAEHFAESDPAISNLIQDLIESRLVDFDSDLEISLECEY